MLFRKWGEQANGSIDQEARDKISISAVLEDKHWRIIDKCLPALPKQEQEAEETRVQSLVNLLISDTVRPVTGNPNHN